MARARDLERGWEPSGVHKEAWEGRPHHAFRKAFVSELKRAGADPDAVEFLVGHSLGLRGVYIDADALPLADAIGRIPDVVVRFDGALGEGPWRLITLYQSERDPGFAPRPRRQRECPERVPAGHRVRNNVLSLDAFFRNGGGGGSRTRVRSCPMSASTCVAPGIHRQPGPETLPWLVAMANLGGDSRPQPPRHVTDRD